MSWETLGKVSVALERWGVQYPEKISTRFEQITNECDTTERGTVQTFDGGLGRSTVAHFASQSEGGEYCGGQALKIQQSHAPERWSCSLRVRGPHFASKVSYNAGAATDDCASQCKFLLLPAISISISHQLNSDREIVSHKIFCL